jgi:hypothetical protein
MKQQQEQHESSIRVIFRTTRTAAPKPPHRPKWALWLKLIGLATAIIGLVTWLIRIGVIRF